MTGCEDRLRNDLLCVGWGVKLYSNQTCVIWALFGCSLPACQSTADLASLVSASADCLHRAQLLLLRLEICLENSFCPKALLMQRLHSHFVGCWNLSHIERDVKLDNVWEKEPFIWSLQFNICVKLHSKVYTHMKYQQHLRGHFLICPIYSGDQLGKCVKIGGVQFKCAWLANVITRPNAWGQANVEYKVWLYKVRITLVFLLNSSTSVLWR